MASITKRGDTYRIRVSCGYDITGKQIIKSITWKPPKGMTAKQIEKELEKQAFAFEEKCLTGQFLDGSITLSAFIDLWFKNYAEKQLKHRTITRYKELLRRILPALGHIKLQKLQPHHLIEFYNNLGEDGIRLDTKYVPCKDFKSRIGSFCNTQKELSERSGVSLAAIRACINGQNVSKETARKLSEVMCSDDLFTVAEGKTKLSDKTISEYHRLLSSVLTTAVQWQVIPFNPCERVKPPKVEQKEALALDSEQAAELIRCLQEEPIKYRSAIMLLLYTGMRRGELCGLEWSDIDLDNGVVKINKTVLYSSDLGTYSDTTKTQSSNRIINIPPDMVKLLVQYKAHTAQQRLKLGDQWTDSGKVFTGENGAVINPDTLSTWFKKFIRRNGLPDIHLHSLRHTAATLLISGGADIATVSKRLGHANKTTTLNIYTHAVKSADEAAANMLQDILSTAKTKKIV